MKRLTKKQMIIFAVGQLGWSTLSGIINAMLVTFYLPSSENIEAGAIQFIKPGLIVFGVLTILGLITAASRIFDAVTDPLIANMSDRCKSKWGRRMPFMQIAAIPLAVVTVLLFCAPVNGVSAKNVVWVSVFIILFYLFMTMYCTPYNALISEFGKTQDDRMFISTAISLTFFAGTLLAYSPMVVAGFLQGSFSFNTSYRVCFAVGLTLFQTGLPFFVQTSMKLDISLTMYFMGGMTVLSAAFYPMVAGLTRKFGKKKLTICGFLGLALAYLITALINVDILPGTVFGVAICVIAAFPMALLGIIPQAIVADVAEADGRVTGEHKEGMFFAARTFAMKWGQSIAMLVFTSLAIIGTTQNVNANDITASPLGLRWVAIVAIAFCLLGALLLTFYNEKKIMKTIVADKEADGAPVGETTVEPAEAPSEGD